LVVESWNRLPERVKTAENGKTFKRRLVFGDTGSEKKAEVSLKL
jgi:hypothetical protein